MSIRWRPPPGRAEAALSVSRTTPAGLDLRARIAAQQGRYDEAASRLGEPDAFDLEPATVARVRSAGWHFQRSVRVAMAVVAMGVAAGTIAWSVGRDDTPARGDQATARTLVQTTTTTSATSATTTPTDPAVLDGLEGRLARIHGVETRRDADGLHLRFTERVFDHGTTLTPAGRVTLAAVARALATDAGHVAVVVTGHADAVPVPPGSKFEDNEELSQARAVAGVKALVDAGLPDDSVSAHVTATPPPYPAADPQAGAVDARNRTITLTVRGQAAP